MGTYVAACIIWGLVGCFFIVWGVYCIFAEKGSAAGFWANAETFPVKEIRAYNKAVGKLWVVFGIVFALLGLPLLFGDNSPYLLFSVLGIMVEVIITMIIYVLYIEKKYRKN